MKNTNPDQIYFEKAGIKHQDIIFKWLGLPHIQEFWDNSQEHKNDILDFIHDRKQHYFYGTTMYWVGYHDGQPFCFVLTDQILSSQNITNLHRAYLSQSGHTISLDFGIGNINFLGKGFASPTLKAFVKFYHRNIDYKADTFFIDPDEDNPRAIHVYKKAGFEMVGDFTMESGFFEGKKTYLLIKKLYE